MKIKNTREPFKRELHGMHTVKCLIFEKNDRGGPAPWRGLDGVTSGGVRPPRPEPGGSATRQASSELTWAGSEPALL